MRVENGRKMFRFGLAVGVLALAFVSASSSAYAYLGPGSAVSALGSLATFLGAAAFAVIGFVWYPVKRLLRYLRPSARNEAEE